MMNSIEQLLTMESFSESAESNDLFLDAMTESIVFHYENSERFREFCIKKNF